MLFESMNCIFTVRRKLLNVADVQCLIFNTGAKLTSVACSKRLSNKLQKYDYACTPSVKSVKSIATDFTGCNIAVVVIVTNVSYNS